MNYLKGILIFKGLVTKTVYNTNDKKKNNDFVIMIKSGLSDVKRKLKT